MKNTISLRLLLLAGCKTRLAKLLVRVVHVLKKEKALLLLADSLIRQGHQLLVQHRLPLFHQMKKEENHVVFTPINLKKETLVGRRILGLSLGEAAVHLHLHRGKIVNQLGNHARGIKMNGNQGPLGTTEIVGNHS